MSQELEQTDANAQNAAAPIETAAQDGNDENSSETVTDDTVPSLACYRSMRIKVNQGKGKRIHFQFSLDEVDLYHAKLKTKHQFEPIPIARGNEVHYSHGAEFYLIPNEEFTEYSLRHNDDEIMFCKFEKRKKEPKVIEVTWSENPDSPIKLVSQEAEKTDAGTYCLDFDGRYAEPSIKNCILVTADTQEIVAMFRRVDEWEMNVDAKPNYPDLMLFAVLLCLNVCPF